MRSLTVIILFIAFAGTGYCLAVRSWGGGVYVYLGEERAPAAVRSLNDYSEVKRDSLYKSAHRQMLDEAEVERRDGHVGLHLGNPLMKNESGGSMFACKVRGREGLYDRIEMTFTGVGVSESGHNAEMVVETPCEAASEASLLSTIWLPMNEIQAGSPSDRSLTFESLSVKLTHVPSVWPENWVLSSVRVFHREGANPELRVEGAKMREARQSLLQF